MIDIQTVRLRMEKVLDIFSEDAATIRTGRATPALIENVEVSAYGGQKMRIIELGSINVVDARTLTFQPWDQSIIKEARNSLAETNIGSNPAIDGNIIRITLPPMTTEQREDYVKLLGRKLEGSREMVRGVRADFRKDLQDAKQNKTISEDEYRGDEEKLQKMTDEYMGKLEALAQKKEKEIREV